MQKEELNEKEKAVYAYIAESIHKNGFSPSVRDIKAALGIKSTSTVHAYLGRLEEKGYITKDDGKSRTVRMVFPPEDGAREAVRLPVRGDIAAGLPILAAEVYDDDDFIEVSVRGNYPKDELFALRVTGKSMINAGIFDGDVIIVHRTPAADNGDIVVALVDDSATVKRIFREGGGFRLQPENDTMEPIYADNLIILGKVIASVRYY
ncbi:MAG: transcriptional repressor LexA [Firmicutes bacterium]|nr:transcriptional repressor LexA [Bacillota bacterium]